MNGVTWTKSESREVRPFFSVENYEQLLDRAEVRLFEGQAFSAAEAFVLQENELERVRPEIRFNLNASALSGGIIDAADVSLLVCLSAPNLKKTRIVAKASLQKGPPEGIEINAEDIHSIGGAENLTIKVGICLNKNHEATVGRPFLEGHWIAKKFFTIRLARQTNQFEVRPRTDAEWKQHGYPEKTLYLVEYTGGMNEPVDKETPIASVWIHADLYNRLAVEVESKKARSIMSFLSAEITMQLILSSAVDWIDADEVTPKSPLSATLKQLSAAEKIDFQKLKQLVKDPGQPRLRALIHNQQGTVRALAEA